MFTRLRDLPPALLGRSGSLAVFGGVGVGQDVQKSWSQRSHRSVCLPQIALPQPEQWACAGRVQGQPSVSATEATSMMAEFPSIRAVAHVRHDGIFLVSC